MSKKICLITGATAGIGKETARQLAAKGIHVVITARSKEKAAATVQEIKTQYPNASLDYLLCDLSSQQSVRKLAQEFIDTYDRLDILINNAGVFYSELQLTEDGVEMQFAVNHLAHFLLTHLLLDILKQSAPSRIVNVSSDSHYGGNIHFDDLNLSKKYRGRTAYPQSKLANVLFTYELDRMLEDTGVTVNALHPGTVDTAIGNTNSSPIINLGWKVIRMFAIPIEKGAETSVYLATSDEVKDISGKYFEKCKAKKSSRASYDKEAALKLWNVSKQLTGL
jgi:NAD(P)-dependent dehydrogenase (short-subunit alcohol dehydrogenase family)